MNKKIDEALEFLKVHESKFWLGFAVVALIIGNTVLLSLGVVMQQLTK